jgi:hypothetical protein
MVLLSFSRGNMSVITNISIPESILKRNSNSIACHCVREAVAMDCQMDSLGHLIKSWLSEHLSFKKSEVIRIPGVGIIYHHEYHPILCLFCLQAHDIPFLDISKA